MSHQEDDLAAHEADLADDVELQLLVGELKSRPDRTDPASGPARPPHRWSNDAWFRDRPPAGET